MKLIISAIFSLLPLMSFSAEKNDKEVKTILEAPLGSYHLHYNLKKIWTAESSENIVQQIKINKTLFFDEHSFTQFTADSNIVHSVFYNSAVNFANEIKKFNYMQSSFDTDTFVQNISEQKITYGKTTPAETIAYNCPLQMASIQEQHFVSTSKKLSRDEGRSSHQFQLNAIYSDPSTIQECESAKITNFLFINFSYSLFYQISEVVVKSSDTSNKFYGQLLNLPETSGYNKSALFYIPTNIYKIKSNGTKEYLYYFYELSLVKD